MTTRSALAALLLLSASTASARPFAPNPEVAALREEIAALQVDHALDLTQAQARALLPLLQQAATQVEAARARMEGPNPALVAALTQARDELRAGGSVSASTQKAIRDARRAAMPAGRGEAQAIRKQALAILTSAQVRALQSVKLGAGTGRGGPDADRGAGMGRGGGMRRLVMLGVLTSPRFLSLLEARTR